MKKTIIAEGLTGPQATLVAECLEKSLNRDVVDVEKHDSGWRIVAKSGLKLEDIWYICGFVQGYLGAKYGNKD